MLKSWPGLIAVILAIISFYGMTYVVIALNTGWRFGYWIAGSVFSVLMFLMSINWLANPVGPRGEEARWVPLAAAPEHISTVKLKNESLSSPGEYPGGPWRPTTKEDTDQADALTSGMTNCLTTALDKLGEDEKAPCTAAQKLMPDPKSIPVIEGSPVAVAPEATNIRFTTENGALLGEVTVVPTTHDPRVAKNPIKGKPMGDPFLLVAVYNKGSLRIPPFVSFMLFGLLSALHLAGLSRAEKRKLSPVAA